jgi:uncharacterized membrane protein YGL010W
VITLPQTTPFADSVQASNSPSLIPLPSYLTIPNLPLDAGTLAAIGYCAFYILLEPIAGTLITPALLASTAYGHHLLSIAPTPTNQIAIGVFVVSWIAQFIGHGAFEGRAPALLDNLVQALVLAPFFVWMEVLFRLGYRPELRARIDKEIEKEVEKFRRSKANGAVKNGTAK